MKKITPNLMQIKKNVSLYLFIIHSLGAAILNAQSSKSLSLLRGSANWLEIVEYTV